MHSAHVLSPLLPPLGLRANPISQVSGTMVGYVTSLSRVVFLWHSWQLEWGGQRAGREPGGAISITSHPSPLVFFSRIEREAAFVLLRTLLEPLIPGLLLNRRKRTQRRVRWLGQMAGATEMLKENSNISVKASYGYPGTWAWYPDFHMNLQVDQATPYLPAPWVRIHWPLEFIWSCHILYPAGAQQAGN